MASVTSTQTTSEQPLEGANIPRNATLETEIRKIMLDLCQHEHLSRSLFPLNDILITPSLLAKIHLPGPDDNPQYAPILYQTLPDLFDSPDLLAGLPYPRIPIEKALQWSPRITVSGYPGTGKTTLLCDISSRLSSMDDAPGALKDSLAIYIHCRNLVFSSGSTAGIFHPLIAYLAKVLKKNDERTIHTSLLAAAREGSLILLLDGLDEVQSEHYVKVVQWLQKTIKEFASLKIITTTIPLFHRTLDGLGFTELTMAPWTNTEKQYFIDQFTKAWFSSYQQSEESVFIPKWLKTANLPATPLDLTLVCWSAFSGNPLGLQGSRLYLPYLKYVTHHPLRPDSLVSLASAMLKNGYSGLSAYEVENLIFNDPVFKQKPVEIEITPSTKTRNEPLSQTGPTPRSVLNELLQAGVLSLTVQGRLIFSHSSLFAALYVQSPDLRLPDTWRAATQSSLIDSILLFSCVSGKIDARISQWLNELDYPLFLNYQVISHWLTSYPSLSKGLLVQAYKKIIPLLQKSNLPVSLQIKLLKPLLLSQEPATIAFIRELAQSENPAQRHAGAFSLSFYASKEADPSLLQLSSDTDPEVQKLAIISLSKSWSTQAQKQLVNIVTGGAPELRQIVGESLAFIPGDGHELLKELAVLPNNPEARKAAVDGLLLINTDWSRALIKKVNIEDNEWLVRDTASNAVKLNSVDHLFRPRRRVAPAYIPWLIKFAASKRMGIYANEFPTDILILAVKDGDLVTQAAAMETLALDPSPESLHFLKQAFLHGKGRLQELAYSGLISLAREGMDLKK